MLRMRDKYRERQRETQREKQKKSEIIRAAVSRTDAASFIMMSQSETGERDRQIETDKTVSFIMRDKLQIDPKTGVNGSFQGSWGYDC